MHNLTEEQITALISAVKDLDELKKVLCEYSSEELIEIMISLNSIIELIEMNQYARLIRNDE